MELKRYQQDVIADLERFLDKIQEAKDVKESYNNFWAHHPQTPLIPSLGAAIEPYKDNITRVPHICIKIPTAGGKTFIACNALKTIFTSFNERIPRAVIWLVPWSNLLDQTV